MWCYQDLKAENLFDVKGKIGTYTYHLINVMTMLTASHFRSMQLFLTLSTKI